MDWKKLRPNKKQFKAIAKITTDFVKAMDQHPKDFQILVLSLIVDTYEKEYKISIQNGKVIELDKEKKKSAFEKAKDKFRKIF